MKFRLSLLTALVGLVSCSDTDPAAAPADGGAGSETWAFLVDSYDSDGDGRITAEEHGRTPRSFQRLDRDKDGFVTAADFERRPRAGRRKAENRAVQLIGRYLQLDEDSGRLGAEELGTAFARQDTDTDGLLSEEEFRCGQLGAGTWAAERNPEVARLLEDVDPWEGLLTALDADGDDAVSREELLGFHLRRGGGQPWVWDIPTEDDLVAQRPLVGQPAPDFTLTPLEGGVPVTLSSFEGDQPVALIFGSYT